MRDALNCSPQVRQGARSTAERYSVDERGRLLDLYEIAIEHKKKHGNGRILPEPCTDWMSDLGIGYLIAELFGPLGPSVASYAYSCSSSMP